MIDFLAGLHIWHGLCFHKGSAEKIVRQNEITVEDLEFAKCLADNVLQVNALDELKRHRFLQLLNRSSDVGEPI
jgi:hypothetical protein